MRQHSLPRLVRQLRVALDVDSLEIGLARLADAHHRRCVHHHLGVGKAALECGGVVEVAFDLCDLQAGELHSGRPAREHGDLSTVIDEQAHEVVADEAGAAGDAGDGPAVEGKGCGHGRTMPRGRPDRGTRPALANELADTNAAGQVVLKLKRPGVTAPRTWRYRRWSSCNGWRRWRHCRLHGGESMPASIANGSLMRR